MNEYDVNLLLTVSKHYRIQAEDERSAKVAAKLQFNKEGDATLKTSDVVHSFLTAHTSVLSKSADPVKTEMVDEEKENFDRFRKAVFDFMQKNDDCPAMAKDVAECFDYEIEPFDPLTLFYWKNLYGVENRFSRDNPFHKEKPFGIRATFIDCRYTHEEEHKDSACEAGTGYELWMDDKYNFFTVHFTELVERDKDGKILMSMRCRELSDEPFYTKTYPFLSEDFLETIEEKIEDAFDNDD